MYTFILSMFTRLWNFQSNIIYSVLLKVFRRTHIQKHSTAITTALSDLKVIYDSEHFIVIDKCADVAMNSYDKTVAVTVDKQLERMYPDMVNKKLEFSFYFAHRLDYSTTGVLCIAKHKKACAAACKAFSSRLTQKYYLAIVRGTLSEDFFTVDEPIGDDTREEFTKLRMATKSMRHCSKKTRDAKTHIAVLERGMCYNYPATKILLQPLTGRRHQLRLHCHHIGHTIVGDFTYSNKRDTEPYRMFLHAYRLILPNAIEQLDVTASDPFTEENSQNNWKVKTVVSSIDTAIENLKRYVE